jgi:DNA-binding IclR family transcriptional regulator
MSRSSANTVKSADRVLTLFELLARWGRELSHAEIAEALEIPKSSLTQLLRNLVGRGYLRFSPETKGYSLGEAISLLAYSSMQRRSLTDFAQPVLTELTAITQETSALNLLRGDQTEVVATVSSPLRLVSHLRLGDLAPLYAISGGKAILAYLPDEMVHDYLARIEFEPITPNTITSVAKLRAQLREIRREGLALSLEEFTVGIIGLARPVLNKLGHPLGSVNVAMPTVRYNSAAREKVSSALEKAASTLSRQIYKSSP